MCRPRRIGRGAYSVLVALRPHREKENSLAPTSGCTAMETEGSWLRLACAHMSGTRKTSPASCSHEARLGLGFGLGIGLGFGLGLG